MRIIKWLLTLADGKPLIFGVAVLLIATAVMGAVVKHQEKKLADCATNSFNERLYYNRKVDSINTYYISRENRLNDEVKEVLNSVIDSYKEQLSEQKKVNDKVATVIGKNKKLLNKNENQLKILQNE